MPRPSKKARQKLVLIGFALGLIGVLALLWWLADDQLDLTNAEALAAVVGGAGLLLAAAGFGPQLLEWTGLRHANSADPGIPANKLEEWRRFLRAAVLDRRIVGSGSSLVAIMRHGTTEDPRLRGAALSAADRPRLKV